MVERGVAALVYVQGDGVPFVLRSEDARFTSLFGSNGGGGVLLGKIGVVEPACENATEPFECETAADPGRDPWLESRDMLLDKRLSQD